MNLTIGDFHAFCLEKGEEAYDYGSNGNCALAQFLHASGWPKATVSGWTYTLVPSTDWDNHPWINPDLNNSLSRCRTFHHLAAELAYLDPSLPIGVPA